MNAKAIAALFALVALPVAAQTTTPGAPARQAPPDARVQQGAPAAQAARKDALKPARAETKSKQGKKRLAKQKEEDRKRKAPAT